MQRQEDALETVKKEGKQKTIGHSQGSPREKGEGI